MLGLLAFLLSMRYNEIWFMIASLFFLPIIPVSTHHSASIIRELKYFDLLLRHALGLKMSFDSS